MISDIDRKYLADLHAATQKQTAALNKITAERNDAIRLALESGAQPTEIARIFEVTRARIHQIRDAG